MYSFLACMTPKIFQLRLGAHTERVQWSRIKQFEKN